MISIAIPAYKTRFLFQAIRSVINQTYKDFELIIVNDASPENVDEIVSKFDDERIRYYVNKKNLGSESLVKNWNKCLEYAKGEYFVLFSDDDIYESQFIERLVYYIDKYPDVNVFRTRVNIIDSQNQLIKTTPIMPQVETASEYILGRLKGERTHYIPEVMFRKSSLIEIGGFVEFPLAWYSDEATLFKVAQNRGVGTINEVLVNWRYSENNISSAGGFRERIKAGILYHAWLEKELEHISIGEIDKKKLLDISEIRNEQNKKNMIIRTARKSVIYGSFDIIKNGIEVRNMFGMAYSMIFLALLSFVKNIVKGNY